MIGDNIEDPRVRAAARAAWAGRGAGGYAIISYSDRDIENLVRTVVDAYQSPTGEPIVRRLPMERSAYADGFLAGAEGVLEAIDRQHPDLDDPEFGGPLSTGREFLNGVLPLLRSQHG